MSITDGARYSQFLSGFILTKSLCISRAVSQQNIRFGLVLDQMAVLKISDWAVKYAAFAGNFLMLSWSKLNWNFF